MWVISIPGGGDRPAWEICGVPVRLPEDDHEGEFLSEGVEMKTTADSRLLSMAPAMTSEIVWMVIVASVISGVLGEVFQPPPQEIHEDQHTPNGQSAANGGTQAVVPWHPNWENVTRCERGERQSRFPACFCGQYAEILPQSYVAQLSTHEREEEKVYSKWSSSGTRKIFYVCQPCSSCPDGVRMTGFCRQTLDTTCDALNECIKADHVFDDRIKACVPAQRVTNPTDPDPPPDPAGPQNGVTNKMETGPAGPTPDDPGPNKSRDYTDSILIGVGVVAGVVVIVQIAFLATKAHKGSRCRHRNVDHVPCDLTPSSSVSHSLQCKGMLCMETVV